MKRLSNRRESEIADLAEEVANSYFPDRGIVPLEITKGEKITHSFGSYLDSFDGMLEYRSGAFHIFCNLDRIERPNSPRARFTLAHELGHFFIDEHRNALRSGRSPAHPSFCEYESSSLVEKEADHFASHLLMPDDRFRKIVLKEGVGIPAVLAACQQLEVSLTSAAIKYVKLDFFVSAVIRWTPEGWGWKWLSNTMFELGYRKTVESPADIPSGSATAQLMKGESLSRRGFADSCSSASDWFPFIEPETNRDISLVEQAVSLGRFGFLTFLYPEEEDLP